MGQTLCGISMTRTHWVCTGRAHSPPGQKGWEQSPLFYSSSNHKGILPVHLDDNGARGVKGLMSEHHKLWRWLCGNVMHDHGSVKFCNIARQNQLRTAEVYGGRSGKFKVSPRAGDASKSVIGPGPHCQPFVSAAQFV